MLLLEDNREDAELCICKLKSAGLRVNMNITRTSREFMECVRSQTYDIILTDYRLPDWSGLEALNWLRSLGYKTPFILVTGTLSDELAIECIRAGATDYVLKQNLERLPVAVRRALEEEELRKDRDRTENKLLESEKQYRLLFEANPNPMWIYALDRLTFLAVNEAAIKHYGYSREEFLSMTVKDTLSPEDLGTLLERVDPLRELRQTSHEYWKHRRKDGSIIDVEISWQPITFEGHCGQLVLAHDVTARRSAEAELRHSKEQLQLLLDSTAEGIYGLDQEGNCTFCNSACLRILGYDSTAALLGRNMHSVAHHTKIDGTLYPEEECPIFRAFLTGIPLQLANEVFWRSDGTPFLVEYWSYPLYRDNRVIGGVVSFFDITQRKDAEESLRRSELQYRSVVEGAPYGIYRVDQDGRIVMANPALVAMLGYQSQQKVLGLDVATDIYLDPAEHQRAISTFLSQGPSVRYETKWKRNDGTSMTVRLAGRALLADEEDSSRFEVFVEDITEQRLLQKQFEHAQKLEAVGRLAGGVAHDFNNLLMIITSYAQLLEESAGDTEKAAEYARHIRDATSRAASVTRQLLAFSRKLVLEPTVLDLNHVVKDLGKMLPCLLGEDVEIVMACGPHLGRVRADRSQIEQVIMNLAINARDAMPHGGRLTIETSNVELESAYSQHPDIDIPPGRYVVVAIADTGSGMDAAIQARIFEPFFTTKEVGKGTGLGLATVYGIVKQSHGFIWLYSEVGKGTAFKIHLPRVDAPADAEQVTRFGETPGGFETVLLVEDEPALRAVSRVYLESIGYSVLDARDATNAMEICKSCSGPIHLLITDMVMPGMGGIELADAALAVRPGLAIMFVSGYADRTFNNEAIGRDIRFLPKPFSLDTLARAVRSILDKNLDKQRVTVVRGQI